VVSNQASSTGHPSLSTFVYDGDGGRVKKIVSGDATVYIGSKMNPPSRSEIIEKFQALIRGELSREAVASWAQPWIIADTPPRMDDDLWEALSFLVSVDMISTDRPYLYSTEDFISRLDQLLNPKK